MSAKLDVVPQSSIIDRKSADELDSPVLRAGVAYWRTIRGDRPFPRREDLRPRDIQGLLPYMALLKVIGGGEDFEHRIVGDILVQAFAVPMQNRRFSEIEIEAPELMASCYPLFREVVNTRAPVAWRHKTGHDNTDFVFVDSEVVLLPLGTTVVDHVLVFEVHWSRIKPA